MGFKETVERFVGRPEYLDTRDLHYIEGVPRKFEIRENVLIRKDVYEVHYSGYKSEWIPKCEYNDRISQLVFDQGGGRAEVVDFAEIYKPFSGSLVPTSPLIYEAFLANLDYSYQKAGVEVDLAELDKLWKGYLIRASENGRTIAVFGKKCCYERGDRVFPEHLRNLKEKMFPPYHAGEDVGLHIWWGGRYQQILDPMCDDFKQGRSAGGFDMHLGVSSDGKYVLYVTKWSDEKANLWRLRDDVPYINRNLMEAVNRMRLEREGVRFSGRTVHIAREDNTEALTKFPVFPIVSTETGVRIGNNFVASKEFKPIPKDG